MISESLSFIAAEINTFLNQKLGVTADLRLKIGNIVNASEDDGFANKIILSLINVEEDKAANIRENFIRNSVIYKNPPVIVNIYILLVANMTPSSAN